MVQTIYITYHSVTKYPNSSFFHCWQPHLLICLKLGIGCQQWHSGIQTLSHLKLKYKPLLLGYWEEIQFIMSNITVYSPHLFPKHHLNPGYINVKLNTWDVLFASQWDDDTFCIRRCLILCTTLLDIFRKSCWCVFELNVKLEQLQINVHWWISVF